MRYPLVIDAIRLFIMSLHARNGSNDLITTGFHELPGPDRIMERVRATSGMRYWPHPLHDAHWLHDAPMALHIATPIGGLRVHCAFWSMCAQWCVHCAFIVRAELGLFGGDDEAEQW